MERQRLWESGFSGKSDRPADGCELPVLADLGQGAARQIKSHTHSSPTSLRETPIAATEGGSAAYGC